MALRLQIEFFNLPAGCLKNRSLSLSLSTGLGLRPPWPAAIDEQIKLRYKLLAVFMINFIKENIMTALFDKFVKKMTDEGVEIERTSGSSVLISHAAKNAGTDNGRQVHSQCTHTNFKDCSRSNTEELDSDLLDALAENRENSRSFGL
jgi:hypothetical protein